MTCHTDLNRYDDWLVLPAYSPPLPTPSAPDESLIDTQGAKKLQEVYKFSDGCSSSNMPSLTYTPYFSNMCQVTTPLAPLINQPGRPHFAEINEQAINLQDNKLKELFKIILYYAINGLSSSDCMPCFLVNRLPVAYIESTTDRKLRYLKKFNGLQELAADDCIRKNHTVMRKFESGALSLIPIIGGTANYTFNFWRQLREVTLIAAIHGHDIHQEETQARILHCLIEGNVMKITSLSIDYVVREIAKKIMLNLGLSETLTAIIPLNVLFNLLTDDAAKVAGQAKRAFAGVHSKPIK